MTLETCKKQLELAKTDEEKEFWTKRIQYKLNKPKYAKVKAALTPKPEVKPSGKKPKR